MKNILVTGFEAFLGETINPSSLVLEKISLLPGVETLLLPVAFERAFPQLQEKLKHNSYDFVLLLGQAGGRSKVSLERIAVNWRESALPDNDGIQSLPGKMISETGEKALFSTLPLEEIKAALEALHLPVEISFSAGAYVCNDLFFKTLSYLQTTNTRCGFIHVPYLPEQIASKPNQPSLPFDILEKALKATLAVLYQS